MELLRDKFTRDHAKHREVLAQLQASLDQLSEITLHPELQAPQRQTLADCVPCNRIEDFAQRAPGGARAGWIRSTLKPQRFKLQSGSLACVSP